LTGLVEGISKSINSKRLQAVAFAAAVLIIVGAGGCGGGGDGGDAANPPDFTEADLKDLVFAPSEAPEGLVYNRKVSGPSMLEKEGGKKFVEEIERRGVVADDGSQFSAGSHGSKLRFAKTIAVLFKDQKTASAGLQFFKQIQILVFQPAREIQQPSNLGQEAWGIRGKFHGKDLTYVYGWRRGDLVQLMTASPKAPDAGPRGTLLLARDLAEHGQPKSSGG
jgi:hypothetical protein